MPVCKHRDSSDEVTMSMYEVKQVLSLWRSCVHWLCWDRVPVGKSSGHACRCSIAALEQLVNKTTGVYRWGACTRLSIEQVGKGYVIIGAYPAQLFQSSELIMDILIYRLNQPSCQCSEIHLKCITRWKGRNGVTITIFFQRKRDGNKTSYV